MSYCVNCGVELEQSEKACPLCLTEVINPRQPVPDHAPRPYPTLLDPINQRINRRFVGRLISIILLLPALLSIAINYSTSGRLDWSLYVCGGLLQAWVWSAPFYLWRRPTLDKLYWPSFILLLAYLYLIDFLQSGPAVFWRLMLPLALLPALFLYLNLLLITRRLVRKYVIPASLIMSAGLVSVGVELILRLFAGGPLRLAWSLYVMIPCLVLALAGLNLARRQAILDEIKRRLHL